MIFTSLLFFCYFSVLFLFSLIGHSVYYCGLLVLKAFICRLICYSILGFGWYPLLFCLVYVGGVYILFVFVSVYKPNNKLISYFKFRYFLLFLVLFLLVSVGRFLMYSVFKFEFREYLCTVREGWFYICMCLTLVFGFIILRMVMCIKLNYYR